MDKKVETIIKTIKEMNDNSCDINSKTITINGKKVAYMFLESTANDDKISNYLGKDLSFDVKEKKKEFFENLFDYLKDTIPNSKLKLTDNYEEMFYYLSSGFTCVIIENNDKAIAIETKGNLDRGISEPTNEPSLKGPKDCFIENYQANIGLIRKRIKDHNLIFSETLVGKRTKTKVAVTYIKDVVDIKKVKKLKKELEKINIDGIIDSSYIRELIITKQKSIVPQAILTERPDLVCISLLNGKIALVVENTPYVLIIPALFNDFFQSPEDYYLEPFNASFTRILRYIAFIIAIFTPGIYIAIVTHNMEILPDLLLINFAVQKEGVPFPTLIEVLILIVSFEILREADTRKPQIMGASISIVGALILGEAAVSANVISPIVVIIVSLSAVSGMVFSNSDVISAIRSWRLLFMFTASLFGITGIFATTIIFITQICTIESWGIPITAPLTPLFKNDLKRSLLRLSQKSLKKRPKYLTKNLTRLKEEE